MDQEKVRLILLEEFVQAQTRNPNYSMRAYAKRVGIGQSAISEILSAKRPITKKCAQKILQGLDRDPKEIEQFLNTATDKFNQKYNPIAADAFQIISDWHHFAILSLSETKEFVSSADWIANRLGITEKAVSEAIEKLISVGLLKKNPTTAELKTTGEPFEFSSAVAVPALRRSHRQSLDLAATALDEVTLDKRDFTSMTLCFDPDRIDDARKMITNFRRNFTRVMESGHRKEVYRVAVQLFPLSKLG